MIDEEKALMQAKIDALVKESEELKRSLEKANTQNDALKMSVDETRAQMKQMTDIMQRMYEDVIAHNRSVFSVAFEKISKAGQTIQETYSATMAAEHKFLQETGSAAATLKGRVFDAWKTYADASKQALNKYKEDSVKPFREYSKDLKELALKTIDGIGEDASHLMGEIKSGRPATEAAYKAYAEKRTDRMVHFAAGVTKLGEKFIDASTKVKAAYHKTVTTLREGFRKTITACKEGVGKGVDAIQNTKVYQKLEDTVKDGIAASHRAAEKAGEAFDKLKTLPADVVKQVKFRHAAYKVASKQASDNWKALRGKADTEMEGSPSETEFLEAVEFNKQEEDDILRQCREMDTDIILSDKVKELADDYQTVNADARIDAFIKVSAQYAAGNEDVFNLMNVQNDTRDMVIKIAEARGIELPADPLKAENSKEFRAIAKEVSEKYDVVGKIKNELESRGLDSSFIKDNYRVGSYGLPNNNFDKSDGSLFENKNKADRDDR
jgi:hypothetical protein